MLFLYAAGSLAIHLMVLLAPDAPSALLASGVLTLSLLLMAGLARKSAPRGVLSAALILSISFLNASVNLDHQLQDRLLPALEGRELEVTGYIASLPVVGEHNLSFELAEVQALPDIVGLPTRLQISWYRSARIPAAGERWRMRVRLRAPRGTLNPGGADSDGWLLRRSIGARASVVKNQAARDQGARPVYPLLRLRAALARNIRVALDGSPMTGLLIGLAVGIRDGISSEQWALLGRTGTGHLVAISGLHVGLVAGLVYWLVLHCWAISRRLSSWLEPVDAARPVAMLAAVGYAALAGFGLPARRALLMLLLLYLARSRRRPLDGARLLALALLGFLASDPLGVLSPGFWLSFLAVSVLLLATRPTVANRLLVCVRTQIRMFIGLAPVTLAAFQQVTLVAPLANLFMIPFFSLILVPLVLLAVLALALEPGAGHWLLGLADRLLAMAWQCLLWLDHDHWQVRPALSPARWCLLLVLSFGLLAPRWPGRAWLLSATGLGLLFLPTLAAPVGHYRLTVLDVGHGLSLVVQTRRKLLVYDLGSGQGASSAFQRVLWPYLHSLGVAGPDIVVLSHDDASHIGDLSALIRAFPAVALISGAPDAISRRSAGIRASPCRQGLRWQWDGVLFEMLYPGPEIIWEDDDSSCVLRITGQGMTTLITGDLTHRGETRLLSRYPDLRADLVVGLAHGSRRASSAALVAALGASAAVVSTSASNPWGLPAAEVVARWQAAGARVWITGLNGAISMDSLTGPRVQSARSRRSWHRR